jgi:hypothetical protein
MSKFSIEKLEQLLATKGFIPKRYFMIHKYCAFVEVVDVKNSNNFFLSIPSTYKFKLKEGEGIYKLRCIDIESDTNTADDYAGTPDDFDLENKYTEVELTNQLLRCKDDGTGNISGYLEEGYKRPISIKDISKEDKKDVKDIVRQIKRLKFCVQNISYKVVIIYMNYLCVLDKDDTIECFLIKRFTKSHCRRLLVVVDLKLFYENDSLEQDIVDIQRGIARVFDKNQETHEKHIMKLLSEQSNVTEYSNRILLKKKEYTDYITRFNNLLVHLSHSEKNLVEKIYVLKESVRDSSYKGMQSDITMVHRKSKLEEELLNLNNVKMNIIKNITEIKNKQEDMLLQVDKVMFDNLVMMAAIVKNNEMLKICAQ